MFKMQEEIFEREMSERERREESEIFFTPQSYSEEKEDLEDQDELRKATKKEDRKGISKDRLNLEALKKKKKNLSNVVLKI